MLYCVHSNRKGAITMAIGERIRFIRNLRGITQKILGTAAGFPEKTADIRLAQYESGTRTPKDDITVALANALGVSPQALAVPDIDSYIGLAHTLFALEDLYGMSVDGTTDGENCLTVKNNRGRSTEELLQILAAWKKQSDKCKSGEITKDTYDEWRYNYPKYDTTRIWAKVPSQEFSDMMVEAFKDKLKDM